MTRPTTVLVLLALTLVAAQENTNDDLATIAISAAQKTRDYKKDSDIKATYKLEWAQRFQNCNDNLTICNGNLSTCDAALSVCETNSSACKTSSAICDGKLAMCDDALSVCETNSSACKNSSAICDDKLAMCDADHDRCVVDLANTEQRLESLREELTQSRNATDQCKSKKVECLSKLHQLRKNMTECKAHDPGSDWQGPPTPATDLTTKFPKVDVDCMAIRRRIENVEMKLKHQQLRSWKMIQRIVGFKSTQAPTPDWQGPPAPAAPAPDYTYQFYLFWLVVLVFFGFRNRPWIVRNAERLLKDASERRVWDACARNDNNWRGYSPNMQQHQLKMQMHTLRMQQENWFLLQRILWALGLI